MVAQKGNFVPFRCAMLFLRPHGGDHRIDIVQPALIGDAADIVGDGLRQLRR